MSLFTDDVREKAQETIQNQSQEQKQEEKPGRTHKKEGEDEGSGLSQWIPAENDVQLYEKLLLPQGRNHDFKLINDYMASGFLTEDELDAVRGCATGYQHMKQLEQILGAQLKGIRDTLYNAMLTVSHSSKSREGAGYETLITQKRKDMQSFKDQRAPEEEKGGGGLLGGLTGGGGPSIGMGVPDSSQVAVDSNPNPEVDRRGRGW